jgi:MraZ protein
MEESGQQNGVSAERPHSIAQASVDEKGRLKLPAEVLAFLEATGVTKVFITTFDLKLARIYPMPVWESNEKLFANAGENSAAAERLAFLAKVYGGDAEIDKAGRVLLPAKLREALGLEKQPVWLDVFKGRINVVTKQIFD